MGEGSGSDELIMPFISSASIACGYHAGDEKTMKDTVDLCLQYNVAVGAHPSLNDRENFGRNEMDISLAGVYQLITEQLNALSKIVKKTKLHHVKPHGALYNMAATNISLAAAIAKAVKDFDETLILYGLAGSYSLSEASKAGLKTASEVFADRTYQDNGTLTPRKQSNALIENTDKAIAQVLQMIKEKTVTSVTGNRVSILAETICIHGDGKNAVELAKTIHQHLKQEVIDIKTI
ncbi:MAG: LamB/YcsF family protein [Chitinophagaceae bacterium]|nr:LamB/YcsF family protein [Chitinophagaceae bacterium]